VQLKPILLWATGLRSLRKCVDGAPNADDVRTVTRLLLVVLLGAGAGGDCAGIKTSPPATTGAGGGADRPAPGQAAGVASEARAWGIGGAGGVQPPPLTIFPSTPISSTHRSRRPHHRRSARERRARASAPCITSPESSTLMRATAAAADRLPSRGTENLFEVVWTIPGFGIPARLHARAQPHAGQSALGQMRTSWNDVPISVTVRRCSWMPPAPSNWARHRPADELRRRRRSMRPARSFYWALTVPRVA